MNDIVARPDECAALVDAYAQQAVCVANTFRCKIPHKKAFFAVLTDERNASLFSDDERAMIRAHVPWTRVVADVDTVMHGRRQRSAASCAEDIATSSCSSRTTSTAAPV